jgi:hypothetical protein
MAKPTIVGAAAAAGTSVAIPAHAVGDTILLVAYRDGSTTVPSKPAAGGTVPAWIDIDANAGANLNSLRAAKFVATATTTTTGTWTNATGVAVIVLRGAGPIGAVTAQAGGAISSGQNAAMPALTPYATDDTSQYVWFMGWRTVTTFSSPPAGYTQQAAANTEIEVVTKDTTNSGASFNLTGTASASGGWRAIGIEVRGSQPSFPNSVTTYDDFNRADGVLGSNWQNAFAGSGNERIASSRLSSLSGASTPAWIGTTPPADGDTYIEVPVLPVAGNKVILDIRVQNVSSGTTWNGYQVTIIPSTKAWTLARVTNAASTTIASGTAAAFAAGDAIGIRANGSILEVWVRNSGTWSFLGSALDSTYSTPGPIGVVVFDTTVRLDNLVGPTVSYIDGASTPSFAMTVTAVGSRGYNGASSTSFATTIAAAGIREPVGASTISSTYTVTANGLRESVGASTPSFATTISATGVSEKVGDSSSSFAMAVAAVGNAEVNGAASTSSTYGVVADGIIEPVGASTISSTYAVAADGIREPVGVATVTTSFSLAVAGSREAVGAASITSTFTVTADGQYEELTYDGAASPSFAIAIVVAGFAEAGGNDGTAHVTSTYTLTASGLVERVGGSSITSTYTVTATGSREAVGVAIVSSTYTVTATGRREAIGSATVPFSLALEVSGGMDGAGQASPSFAISVVASGLVESSATASVTFSFGASVAGAQVAVPEDIRIARILTDPFKAVRAAPRPGAHGFGERPQGARFGTVQQGARSLPRLDD